MKRIVYGILVVVGLILAASIILPLLNRARHPYSSRGAGGELHQIGLGILLYCNDYSGQFPDSLATLVAHEQLSPEVLVDPASDDTAAKGSPQEIAVQLSKPGHQTFIYLGAGLTDKTADADRIVAYEPLAVYKTGTFALYGDGHSEFLAPERLKEVLAYPSTKQSATYP